MAQKKNVTFNDIAEYTHFSKTTISRYFNNPDSLTLENQAIISDALVKLNYKENKVARILANGKTEFIGIIIPSLYLHYFSEILDRILSTYETFGYKFLVFVGNEKKEVEKQYIKELLAYKIEGLIVLSHTISSKSLAALNIPIVSIEREDQYICSVNTDNYMGGVQAAGLLASHNCDVLIHINSPTGKELPTYGRIQGFLDICEEQHLKHQVLIRDLKADYESTQAQLEKIIDDLDRDYAGQKKGIFISNDTHANTLEWYAYFLIISQLSESFEKFVTKRNLFKISIGYLVLHLNPCHGSHTCIVFEPTVRIRNFSAKIFIHNIAFHRVRILYLCHDFF